MNLGEALAAKAKEQGIKTMAIMPNSRDRHTGGKRENATDEEILEAWKQGCSKGYIVKHLYKCSFRRVRRIIKEDDGGAAE